MDPSAYGCRRRRLATRMTRQRGSGPGCVEAALKTSISASSAASASSMNGRSESSSRHPPVVDRLMHDNGSAWPRRTQRSSSKVMPSRWGNWAAQDCPRCARAAFVQRSFRNVLRSFYDELGAQTSRSAPFLPQELDSREDTSRNGEGARAADREGQLRDDGHADLGGLAFAEGRDVEDRRVSDQEAPSGRRHHAGEEQHGGVRVRSDGNGELAAARLHAQPDINDYLPRLAPDAQAKTLEDIIKSGKFHPSIEKRLLDRQAEPPLTENPRCTQVAQNTQQMREAVQKVMDDNTLDALVYPTWAFPPRMIGDLNTPHGNNSPRLSPPTGFPAITVPMGFVRDSLPVGLQVLGRAWSEPTLIKIVYAYEQATRHRRPPASTPPLPARP